MSTSPSRSTGGGPSNPELRAISTLLEEGIPPRVLLNHLAPSFRLPENADDMMLWRLIVSIIDPPRRKKLPHYNTISDAINLIATSKKILVLSGAGISTSAGLPDFRSRKGIYVQIHSEHPDLEDPKSMFDIHYFRKNPRPFYHFAKALFPGQHKPTIGHKFIRCLEDHNKLLRNYTQNIDTLERVADIKRVIECHGSFAKATCTRCKYSVDGDAIKDDIFAQKIPRCPKCSTQEDEPGALGVMKPNIVFFGEQLSDNFHRSFEIDKDEVDLLIIIGSSLKVRPVALIPNSIPANVPQILINKEPLDHMEFDIELLGNCDDIIQELCLGLGANWTDICEPNRIKSIEYTSPLSSLLADPVEEPKGGLVDNMIEHTKQSEENESALTEPIEGSDDEEWEDVEIVNSSSSSSDSSQEKISLQIPDSHYCFLKPNKYLFKGAELSQRQFETCTRE